MNFQHLIRGAAQRLQLSDEVGDGTRSLEIAFKTGDVVHVEHHEARDVVSLASLLCFYPPEPQQTSLFETLLQAHTFGLLTDGAAFAVDPSSSKVFLAKTLPMAQLDSETFAQELERFHQMARFWKQAHDDGRLGAVATPTGESGKAGAAVLPMGIRA